MRSVRTPEEQETILHRTLENSGVRAGAGLGLFGVGVAVTGLVVDNETMAAGGYLTFLTGVLASSICGVIVIKQYDRENN